MTRFARSIVALALLVALVAIFMFATHAPTAPMQTRTVATTSTQTPASVTVDHAANSSPAYGSEVDPRVAAKYRYLLEELPTERAARLLALLQARELAAKATNEGRWNARLDESERDVLAALEPMQRDTYLALRDSDTEQRALDDFVGGISQDTPIDAQQRRDLLLSKLHYKREFEQWRVQSSLDLAPLSSEQREYAHELLTRGLKEYRDAYLLDMRARLDDEQFRRLSDYEHTEFALALERLQQEVNAR